MIVTGATGNSGRILIQMLRAAGIPFRCMARRQEAQEELAAQGFEVVYGDFDKPETLAPALTGVRKAYLVSTPDEELAQREGRFIEAARGCGVRHIVKLSALLASAESPSPILRSHAEVEALLKTSGIGYTVLRSTGFWQTLYVMSHELIESQGVMGYPAGNGRVSFVDLRDVAAAAMAALTSEDHMGKIYDLTGSEAVSFPEMAETLSRVRGRPVAYIDVPEEQMSHALSSLAVPPAAAEHVVSMFRLVRNGELELTTDDFAKLGIEPAGFTRFAEDLAAQRTAGASSFDSPPSGS